MPHLCTTCFKAARGKKEPKCQEEELEIEWSAMNLQKTSWGAEVNVDGGVEECSGYQR